MADIKLEKPAKPAKPQQPENLQQLENPQKLNKLTLLLAAIYLLALTWLIIFKLQFSVPVMTGVRIVNLVPLLGSFGGGVIGFSEIWVNILAFVPLGIYLCMLKSKWSFARKLIAMAVLSLAFEVTQFAFAIGRADITDVLGNTLGGIIGLGIYVLISKLSKGKTNQLINVIAVVITISATVFIAFLLVNNHWVRFS